MPGDTWELTKPVVNLPAPALYRFRVRFRWIGSHGHVIATDVNTPPDNIGPRSTPNYNNIANQAVVNQRDGEEARRGVTIIPS